MDDCAVAAKNTLNPINLYAKDIVGIIPKEISLFLDRQAH